MKNFFKKIKFNFQTIFCLSSFVFILVCIFWYGGRFIYFYLDNQKTLQETERLIFSEKIKTDNYNSENFKQVKKEYYFYNNATNNYVSYSNLLWRIIKINEDNSILLITDNIIGTLAYGNTNTPYQDSNQINWLNNNETGKFIKVLNEKEKYLNNTTTCIDNINDIENITCKNKDSNYYLGLLSIKDYLNTGGTNSFINNGRYSYLANKNDESKIWYITNEGKLNTNTGEDILGIKTTITIASTIKPSSGNGSINDPYKFEESTNLIGSYVKLGEDIWRIYEEKDDIIKLISQETIKSNNENLKFNYSNSTYYHNDTKSGSLAYYLNKTYYNNLSYKNLIIENTYTNGLYGKTNDYQYTNISSKTIKTKITIPSLDDVIYNDNLNDYFTNTGKLENQEAIYTYKGNGITSPKLVTNIANIVPCISINIKNLTLGSGTITDPYRTE